MFQNQSSNYAQTYIICATFTQQNYFIQLIRQLNILHQKLQLLKSITITHTITCFNIYPLCIAICCEMGRDKWLKSQLQPN